MKRVFTIAPQPSSNPFTRWVDGRINRAINAHVAMRHQLPSPVILDQLAMMRRLGIDSADEFTAARIYQALPPERKEQRVGTFLPSMHTVPNEWELSEVEAWERRIMERNRAARVRAHVTRQVAKGRSRIERACMRGEVML